MVRDQRRLVAIVSADVAGYSRLMGRDDSDTLARLKAHRRELIDPKIAEHGGRIVKTTGDGLLLEFPSVVDAVRCAVDVQRGMAERNVGLPPDQRIDFRVGINVGDIIIDGDDIYGDGVNVAARVQTLAEPGGICVSGSVREQVHGNVDVGFDDIGEQQVKNIARPIRVYHVTLAKGTTPQLGLKKLLRRLRWSWAAAAIGLVTIGALAVLFVRGWPGPSATAPAATSATVGQPPALSIAILPFAVAGGSPPDDQLAESITQEVTTALARRARYALVVSHGLVSGYKGKAIDARAVGRELNVRYLTDGEIRHAGDKLVVNTRLIDTSNATQAWNDRLDMSAGETTVGYDVIAGQLAKRIKNALFDAESRRAAHQSGGSASAVDLWLRGSATDDGSLKGAREARKLYDEALRLDPSFVGALVGQVSAIDNLLQLDPQADHDRLVQEAEDFSRRAVAADRNDPRAWSARSYALTRQWRWAEALEASAEAVRIDPSRRTDVDYDRAFILIWTGRPEEVFAQLDKAIALEPREADDALVLHLRCRAHLALGHYDEAINACERAAALENPWLPYLYLTAAYAQKGETAKAAAAKAQLLKYQPGYTIARFKALRISDNPIYWQQAEAHIFTGLRKTGIPEQ